MFAKQTCVSASLVALLGGSVTAYADADPEEPVSGEVHLEADRPVPEPPPEKPRRGVFAIGAGYSSVESFVAMATIAQPDLFGTGDGLALTARISKLRQLFALRFTDPSLFRSGYALTADLFHDERVLPGFTRVSSGGALTLSREVAPHLHAFATYRLEQVSQRTDVAWIARSIRDVAPLDPLLSSLRGGLEYNTLDDPLLPTRGTRIGGSIEVADRRLGSDVNLLRTEAWASTHAPLGPLTLHLGGRMSAVSGEVPRTERLFLDPREVRGFMPGELGPLDGWGMPAGGTMKVTGRAELELPLIRKAGISAVGFLDAGGVLERGLGASGMSYGVGFVWRSPIGPLRFDWAWRPDGGPPVFGFGIGL